MPKNVLSRIVLNRSKLGSRTNCVNKKDVSDLNNFGKILFVQ